MVKSDPFAGGKCHPVDCLPCKAGVLDSKCSKRNVLYESECLSCLKEGKSAIYIGESSRSAYERSSEHLDGYKSRNTDNHMWRHAQSEHEGNMNLEWKFTVIRVFQKALARQLNEAVRVKLKGEDNVLNEKGVYNRCAVPELAVKHNQKLWETEKDKFKKHSKRMDDENEYELLINKTDQKKKEGRKRKQETSKEQTWGSTGTSEEQYKLTNFFLKGGPDNTKKSWKQRKLNLPTAGETITMKIVNDVVDEAVSSRLAM